MNMELNKKKSKRNSELFAILSDVFLCLLVRQCGDMA